MFHLLPYLVAVAGFMFLDPDLSQFGSWEETHVVVKAVLVAVGFIFSAPWLPPVHGELHWMVPAATLLLLIPAFIMSWFIEYRFLRRWLKDVVELELRETVWNANLLSYALLSIVIVCWLARNLLSTV